MTVKTCLKLAEHCKSKGDLAGEKMYLERADRKIARYPKYAHLRKEEPETKAKKPSKKTDSNEKNEVLDGQKPTG